MDVKSHIYIAGHRGLVGSAILRKLESKGYGNISTRTRNELDLCNQQAVFQFFAQHRPEYVFMAAAKVGGIYANSTYPADFISDNLMIQNNIINASYQYGVKKLLFLGSSCIYPKFAPQPMKEEYLLTGKLEPTNASYAIAKIAGIAMCEAFNSQYGTDFMAVMPTNIYGVYDHFDTQNSHVLPALIRKIHDAKQNGEPYVEVWGTGTPLREFLYVDDLADACVYLMEHYNSRDIGPFINIGTGLEISIADLANKIKHIIGYTGELRFNPDKPDGTPRKLLDVSALHKLGWKASTSLDDGIRTTYDWFINHYVNKVELP